MDEVEDPMDYDLQYESVTSLSPEALASMRVEGRAKEPHKMTEFGVFGVVPHEQTVGKQFISTRWEEISRLMIPALWSCVNALCVQRVQVRRPLDD